MQRLVRSQKGQAIVETAIVLPIILLLLFAILDAGRVFHTWIVVTNGAREGARAASTRQDTATVLQRVEDAMTGMDPSQYVVEINPSTLPGISGDPVQVTVKSDVNIITPLIERFFGGDVTVSGSAVMRTE